LAHFKDDFLRIAGGLLFEPAYRPTVTTHMR